MKFSIIVPIFNGEKYLNRCVDSILRQKSDDWELLLIDDGSLDNSGHLAESLAGSDKRIRVIHQENHGQFSARETGIRAAKGEWLLFLDCDDFWEDHCLERLEKAITEHDPDCILFPANQRSEKGELLRIVGQFSPAEQWIIKEELYHRLLTSHQFNAIWSKVFRKELFHGDEADYSALQGSCFGEDKVRILYPLTRAERVFFLAEPLYNYIRRPNSVSASSPDKASILMAKEMFRFTYEYAKKWNMDSPEIRREMTAYYLRHFLSVYYGARRKWDRKVFRSYPWNNLLNKRARKHWLRAGLTPREMLKLFLAIALHW